MKKETIKTIILSLLIINCIQLTAQIWLNKKLWPDGYDFFSNVTNIPVIGDVVSFLNRNSSAGQIADTTTMPDKIVINGGGARTVTHSSNKDFFEIIDFISPYIGKVFATSGQQITEQDWQTMLRGKSVYVEFGFQIDAHNLAAIFDTTAVDAARFGSADAMILYPESVINTTSVCFKNKADGTIIKYALSVDTDKLAKYIENKTIGKKHEHAFAFELRLDGDTQSEVQRKVLLESDVLLTMESEPQSKLVVSSIFHDEDAVSEIGDRVLNAFGYNPSQLRKTVNQDGIVSYVENGATVKVYPDGLIEYTAVTVSEGIKISDAKASSSTIVNKILNIAEKVISNAGMEGEVILKLRSPLNETPVSSYTARFDRYYNGLPIIANGGNTLFAQFENGYITRFHIRLNNLSLSDTKATPPTVINTIDKLFETLSSDTPVLINNIYQCYYVKGEGEYTVKWCIRHDGIITVP